jgi:hypothetical protein
MVLGQAESYLALLTSAQGTPADALQSAQAFLLTTASGKR